LAEAHLALGYVKFRIDWDWAGAETEFKRALQLKPGYARAHEVYALYLAIQRRLDEAMAEMRRAQQLDPLSTSVSNGLGRILHFQSKFGEALAQYRKTLELDPDYAEAYFSMGMSFLGLKQYDQSIDAIQTAIRLSGRRQVIIAMLALAEGLAGKKAEAQKIYDEMLEQSKHTTVSPYYFGIILVGLGETDRAIQCFDQAFLEKEGIMIYLNLDPVIADVRFDPRTQAIVKKMGLPVGPSAAKP